MPGLRLADWEERTRQSNNKRREFLQIIDQCSPEARQYLFEFVLPRLKENPTAINDVYSDEYFERPVKIKQFIEDPYYLGQTLGSGIYPKVKESLIELFDGNYFEVVLGGAIGWGKSTMAYIGVAYDIYLVSCIKSPAQSFGLIPGSNVAFLNVSVNKRQAQRIMFSGLFNLIKNSPYFRERFQWDKSIETELRFPRNVFAYPVAASPQAMLGEGVFSAAFDEMNFYQVVEDSRKNPEGGEFDQAFALYNLMSRRIRSRMNKRGRLPGHLWLVSSARYPNDFTERKAAEALTDPTIFVREYSDWETKPSTSYMQRADGGGMATFDVEVGDITRRTRVLIGEEKDVDPQRVIRVPEDYREVFTKDPDGAVRDHAGISVLTVRPFITQRHLVAEMFKYSDEHGMKHPYSEFTVTLQDASEHLLQQNFHFTEQDDFDETGKEIKKVKLAPGPYFAHVDLALRNDACFVAGTPITIADGTKVAIEKLSIGDRVLQADGKVGTVLAVHRKQTAEIVELTAYGGRTIRCTPDHLILCVKRNKIGKQYPGGSWSGVSRNESDWTAEWIPAGQICKKDYVCISHLNETSRDTSVNFEGHKLELDADLGWLIGMFLAEGSFVKHKGSNITIQFSLHKREENEANKIRRIFLEKFWTESKRWTHGRNGATLRIRANQSIVRFFHWACGEYCDAKRLAEPLFNGCDLFIRGVVEGLWMGDGCALHGNGRYADTWQVKTTSQFLASQLEQILLRFGVHCFVFVAKAGGCKPGQKSKRDAHTISVFGSYVNMILPGWSYEGIRSNKGRTIRNQFWSPVRNIVRTEENAHVYDLTVSPGSTYCAGGIAVHNCGFAVGHIVGWRKVWRGVGPDRHEETKPIIRIDLVLQIVAPKYGEINIASVRGLLYALREMGMYFGMVSYDSWNSADSIQTLKSAGFTAEVFSLDRDTEGYQALKDAIYDARLLCYSHPILNRELTSVMLNEKKGKIDHTPQGSKDCSDAVAGVVYHAEQSFATGYSGEWQDVMTVQKEDTSKPILSDREELEMKIANGIPLNEDEIRRL